MGSPSCPASWRYPDGASAPTTSGHQGGSGGRTRRSPRCDRAVGPLTSAAAACGGSSDGGVGEGGSVPPPSWLVLPSTPRGEPAKRSGLCKWNGGCGDACLACGDRRGRGPSSPIGPPHRPVAHSGLQRAAAASAAARARHSRQAPPGRQGAAVPGRQPPRPQGTAVSTAQPTRHRKIVSSRNTHKKHLGGHESLFGWLVSQERIEKQRARHRHDGGEGG